MDTIERTRERTPECVNAPRKHHYLPVFYTSGWVGPDGRLCEFSRPYDVVKPKMTHPSGTGYVIDLYTVRGLEAEASQSVETRFMKRVDQLACDALRLLRDGSVSELNVDQRSAWSRFVISFVHRHPEKVAWISSQIEDGYKRRLRQIEKHYEAFRQPGFPKTFSEFCERLDEHSADKAKALLLQEIVDSDRVGSYINSEMAWHVVYINDLKQPLLTSDRPVIMTNGIKYDMSYLMLPMSPYHLFIATKSSHIERQLRESLEQGYLVDHVNNKIVSQAKRFAYFTDDTPLTYVESRLGRYKSQFVSSLGYPF